MYKSAMEILASSPLIHLKVVREDLKVSVADLGGGGGVQGVATPPKAHTKCTTNIVLSMQKHRFTYIAMSMVVVVVSSEPVVKPRSRQAVVKPEVLYLLECQLLELCTKCVYELGQ